MSYLKPQIIFSLNLASIFSVIRDNSSVLFGWNFLWFGQKEPIKVKILKLCFWPRYIIFELKKYRGVMFDGTEDWLNNWKKTELDFQKWHEKFGMILSWHSKASKLEFWWDSFIRSRKYMALKFTGELYVTSMRNDKRFEDLPIQN